MAPESERANMSGICGKCNLRVKKLPNGRWEHVDKEGNRVKGPVTFHEAVEPLPNEPTVTCSEVVEGLRRNCLPGKAFQSFDVTKAAAILHEWLDRHLMQVRHDYRTELKKLSHSWLERRVQELEERLAKRSLTPELSSTQPDTGSEKK